MCYNNNVERQGCVVQLEEHKTFNFGVGGLSPLTPTKSQEREELIK